MGIGRRDSGECFVGRKVGNRVGYGPVARMNARFAAPSVSAKCNAQSARIARFFASFRSKINHLARVDCNGLQSFALTYTDAAHWRVGICVGIDFENVGRLGFA